MRREEVMIPGFVLARSGAGAARVDRQLLAGWQRCARRKLEDRVQTVVERLNHQVAAEVNVLHHRHHYHHHHHHHHHQ